MLTTAPLKCSRSTAVWHLRLNADAEGPSLIDHIAVHSLAGSRLLAVLQHTDIQSDIVLHRLSP